jgi:hypothetical protein
MIKTGKIIYFDETEVNEQTIKDKLLEGGKLKS